MQNNVFSSAVSSAGNDERTVEERSSLFKNAYDLLKSSVEDDGTLLDEYVNQGMRLFVSTSSILGLPLNDTLRLWKLYLRYIRKHQASISSSSCESVVASLLGFIDQGLSTSYITTFEQSNDVDSHVKKQQLLLFFCQRLITTVVYLPENLSDATIIKCLDRLFICRGVCFSLNLRFPNQEAIITRVRKFDALFISFLGAECEGNGMGPSRRVELFYKKVEEDCAQLSFGVYRKYSALGALGYLCSNAFLLDENLIVVGPGQVEEINQKTTRVVQSLQAINQSLVCLTISFCGDINDQVLLYLVEEAGQKINTLIQNTSYVKNAVIMGFLLSYCLRANSSQDGLIRSFVSSTWARLLFVTVYSNGLRSPISSVNFPELALTSLLVLVRKGKTSPDVARSLFTQSFALLCRAVFSVNSSVEPGMPSFKAVSRAEVLLKESILELESCHTTKKAITESIVDMAFPGISRARSCLYYPISVAYSVQKHFQNEDLLESEKSVVVVKYLLDKIDPLLSYTEKFFCSLRNLSLRKARNIPDILDLLKGFRRIISLILRFPSVPGVRQHVAKHVTKASQIFASIYTNMASARSQVEISSCLCDMLFVSTDLIQLVSQCVGPIEESHFNACRDAFMLLYKSLGDYCKMPLRGKPSKSSEASISLLKAVMWSALLRATAELGSKIKESPKLKDRVLLLIPRPMLHLVQAYVRERTVPISPDSDASSPNAWQEALSCLVEL